MRKWTLKANKKTDRFWALLALFISSILLRNMHGNKYDTDVTTWSPEGKLHQVLKGSSPLKPRSNMPEKPRSREVLAVVFVLINMLFLVRSAGSSFLFQSKV